ncbi:MAG: hypothetical protein ACO1TE_18830 [Prosthecobacter sp.]
MRTFLASLLLVVTASSHAPAADDPKFLLPTLVGVPWTIAHNPDLGELTGTKQEPVDFGIWQAADDTWQVWSCIRATKAPGRTRVFHRWEGATLTSTDWKPMGMPFREDTTMGEELAGLQAPYVTKVGDEYFMFYGDWNRICLATSKDGKTFTRRLNSDGNAALFIDDKTFINCRDAMVVRINDLWHCYYCVSHAGRKGKIYVRTSKDLKTWGAPEKVSQGSECPFVVEQAPGKYYLFRCHRYGAQALSRVVFSENPLDFGVEDDAGVITKIPCAAPEIVHHEGQYYIAYLRNDLQGIQISKLEWKKPAPAVSR